MKKFDLIAFDCDGVLVDSEPITNGVLMHMLNDYGWEINLQQTMQIFSGHNLRAMIAEIETGIARALPDDFYTKYRALSHAALAEQVQAVSGIHEVLDALQLSDQKFCVASGAERKKMEVTLGRTCLLNYFSGRMFSGMEVARTKPAPDVYLYAARTFNVNPERCVVVEDTPTGIRAGLAAGMKVLAYSGSVDENILLAAGAHQVFSDMRCLPDFL